MKPTCVTLTLGVSLIACLTLAIGEEAGKAAPPPAAADQKGEKIELKTTKDRTSYAFGVNIGKSLKAQSLDVDLGLLAKGIQDAMGGGKCLLTDQECMQVMQDLRREMTAKQSEGKKAAAEKNKKEGDAFLAENAKQPGVETLPSGLQYKIITAGTGPRPKLSDTVKTHYKGTLIDGKEFDSSYSRGEPATFPVTGVIKGWTEALQLMPVGSKWQLYIPAALAYGDRGAGQDIGPGATLIFDIELLSIESGQ
jgi:FKBP-type peptidyl-prolyl cis-trans isomerase